MFANATQKKLKELEHAKEKLKAAQAKPTANQKIEEFLSRKRSESEEEEKKIEWRKETLELVNQEKNTLFELKSLLHGGEHHFYSELEKMHEQLEMERNTEFEFIVDRINEIKLQDHQQAGSFKRELQEILEQMGEEQNLLENELDGIKQTIDYLDTQSLQCINNNGDYSSKISLKNMDVEEFNEHIINLLDISPIIRRELFVSLCPQQKIDKNGDENENSVMNQEVSEENEDKDEEKPKELEENAEIQEIEQQKNAEIKEIEQQTDKKTEINQNEATGQEKPDENNSETQENLEENDKKQTNLENDQEIVKEENNDSSFSTKNTKNSSFSISKQSKLSKNETQLMEFIQKSISIFSLVFFIKKKYFFELSNKKLETENQMNDLWFEQGKNSTETTNKLKKLLEFKDLSKLLMQQTSKNISEKENLFLDQVLLEIPEIFPEIDNEKPNIKKLSLKTFLELFREFKQAKRAIRHNFQHYLELEHSFVKDLQKKIAFINTELEKAQKALSEREKHEKDRENWKNVHEKTTKLFLEKIEALKTSDSIKDREERSKKQKEEEKKRQYLENQKEKLEKHKEKLKIAENTQKLAKKQQDLLESQKRAQELAKNRDRLLEREKKAENLPLDRKISIENKKKQEEESLDEFFVRLRAQVSEEMSLGSVKSELVSQTQQVVEKRRAEIAKTTEERSEDSKFYMHDGVHVPIHGFTNEEIMKDSRMRLQIALTNAGFMKNEYARFMISNAAPARRPNPGLVSNVKAFSWE